ncbi:hypothetical protein D6C97_01233 [Aureobasidium pullulans]|nr:hypothetical protein D6C97_01233 [Aureobasidium pullulans]
MPVTKSATFPPRQRQDISRRHLTCNFLLVARLQQRVRELHFRCHLTGITHA